jgi:hypothetical protein
MGGREEKGAFAAFISTVLASALLQHLEPSLSLSLFSSLLFSLCLSQPLFLLANIYIYIAKKAIPIMETAQIKCSVRFLIARI